jgi:hypothetical protein
MEMKVKGSRPIASSSKGGHGSSWTVALAEEDTRGHWCEIVVPNVYAKTKTKSHDAIMC